MKPRKTQRFGNARIQPCLFFLCDDHILLTASTSHGFNCLEDDLGQEEDGNEALPTVSTRDNEGIGSSTLTNSLKNHLGKGMPVSWP